MSQYTAFEAPDPMYWCRQGYAVVYPDPRGSWYSEGELRHGGMGESEDCFDLIIVARRAEVEQRQGGDDRRVPTSPRSSGRWRRCIRRISRRSIRSKDSATGIASSRYHGGIPETSFLPRGSGNLEVFDDAHRGHAGERARPPAARRLLDEQGVRPRSVLKCRRMSWRAGRITACTRAARSRPTSACVRSRSGSKCTGARSGRTTTSRLTSRSSGSSSITC